MEFESTLPGNKALLKDTPQPDLNRAEFFKDVNNLKFTEVAEKYGFFKGDNSTFVSKLSGLIKSYLKCGMRLLKALRHPNSSIRTFRYNSIKGILHNKYISFAPDAFCQISKNAKLDIQGFMRIGYGRYKRSRTETKILIDNGGKLIVKDQFVVGYGSDIEIFPGAELVLKGKGGSNMYLTIICGERIEIGEGVQIGRGVTIRDNNGNHYINRSGYKNTNPVIIGDKVWLCEGCTIMPGVKIGHGAIIGAKAFVTSNVPPNAMVIGNPAKIVDEDVLWKY